MNARRRSPPQRHLLDRPHVLHCCSLGDPDLPAATNPAFMIGSRGRVQYGAWREGAHDDLLFAAALAYWSARKM